MNNELMQQLAEQLRSLQPIMDTLKEMNLPEFLTENSGLSERLKAFEEIKDSMNLPDFSKLSAMMSEMPKLEELRKIAATLPKVPELDLQQTRPFDLSASLEKAAHFTISVTRGRDQDPYDPSLRLN